MLVSKCTTDRRETLSDTPQRSSGLGIEPTTCCQAENVLVQQTAKVAVALRNENSKSRFIVFCLYLNNKTTESITFVKCS